MNIHLVDVDSKIPNLALMKLSAYHKQQGNEVSISKMPKKKSLFDFEDIPDIVYVSIIFRKNQSVAEDLDFFYPDSKVIVGGSGYDLKAKLPDEIEKIKPDYSLYPDIDYSLGYTTRGCNRNCSFCIVPEKEGKFRHHHHPKQFYDDKFNKITLLDNNILFDKLWFREVVSWCNESLLDTWFTQGLDIRLIDDGDLKLLSEMNCSHMIEFAWDNIKDKKIIEEKIKLVSDYFNLRQKVQFYVYVSSDKDFKSGLYRCQELKKMDTNAFLMFNQESKKTQRIKNLIRWVNRKQLFWSCDFEDYDRKGYNVSR